MRSKLLELANQNMAQGEEIKRSLVEKALAMRCISYLSQVKAQLLTDTIYQIDQSKKLLSQSHTQLKHEMKERKLAEQHLRRAKDDAEQATRLRDKFVALVSHDLRTPLMVINMAADMLMTEEEIPDSARALVADMQNACRNMGDLIEEVLSLSRLRAAEITPQLVSLSVASLAESVLAAHRPIATRKGVALENRLPESWQVDADEKLLREVINNLVSNAIKFSEPGGLVTIEPAPDSTSDLRVVDTGIGIDPSRLKTLFDYEAHTSTRGTAGETGTGLGLPLARDIMRAHGGDLLVESTPNVGTVLLMHFPPPTPAHARAAGQG